MEYKYLEYKMARDYNVNQDVCHVYEWLSAGFGFNWTYWTLTDGNDKEQ
jgi:hypothetical protein